MVLETQNQTGMLHACCFAL